MTWQRCHVAKQLTPTFARLFKLELINLPLQVLDGQDQQPSWIHAPLLEVVDLRLLACLLGYVEQLPIQVHCHALDADRLHR